MFYVYNNIIYPILAVRKVGHLNIKINVFDFEARVLIGWLENTLVNEPTRTRASMSNIFMLRWPIFLTASIVTNIGDDECQDVIQHLYEDCRAVP